MAAPSFDVWSVGVMFYELCAGKMLFAQDIANDELVEQSDITRLCTSNVISDEELEPVFVSAEMAEQIAAEPQLQQDGGRRCEEPDPIVPEGRGGQAADRRLDPGTPLLQPGGAGATASADAVSQFHVPRTGSTVNAEYDKKGLHN